MGELFGDGCFDFDDLRIFNTYQIETNHEYIGEHMSRPKIWTATGVREEPSMGARFISHKPRRYRTKTNLFQTIPKPFNKSK